MFIIFSSFSYLLESPCDFELAYFTGIPLRSGRQWLAESLSHPMVLSSSPRQPTTALEPSGLSTLQVDAESGQISMPSLDALLSQVQQLVANQALLQQQVQQMYASQAIMQHQMQALLAQRQNPDQPSIPAQPNPNPVPLQAQPTTEPAPQPVLPSQVLPRPQPPQEGAQQCH